MKEDISSFCLASLMYTTTYSGLPFNQIVTLDW
jgi:hypothetical protein